MTHFRPESRIDVREVPHYAAILIATSIIPDLPRPTVSDERERKEHKACHIETTTRELRRWDLVLSSATPCSRINDSSPRDRPIALGQAANQETGAND